MFFINHTETINERIIVVEANGALDSETSPGFEEYTDQLIENNKLFIIIDAANLEYVSSAGIGAFIYSEKKIIAAGGFMVICNLPDEISSLYNILGFDRAFRIVSTKEEAMEIMDKQIELRADSIDFQTTGEDESEDSVIADECRDDYTHSEFSLEGERDKLPFESPIILECAECKSIIRIKRAGNYICPDCKTDFSIDEDQTIIF